MPKIIIIIFTYWVFKVRQQLSVKYHICLILHSTLGPIRSIAKEYDIQGDLFHGHGGAGIWNRAISVQSQQYLTDYAFLISRN